MGFLKATPFLKPSQKEIPRKTIMDPQIRDPRSVITSLNDDFTLEIHLGGWAVSLYLRYLPYSFPLFIFITGAPLNLGNAPDPPTAQTPGGFSVSNRHL